MPVLVIDKHGHDDNGENESEKRLAGAVSKREPDSRGTSPRMTSMMGGSSEESRPYVPHACFSSIRARKVRSRSWVRACGPNTSWGGPSRATRPASMKTTREETSRAKDIS
jgi:hypothetical protein